MHMQLGVTYHIPKGASKNGLPVKDSCNWHVLCEHDEQREHNPGTVLLPCLKSHKEADYHQAQSPRSV